MGWVSLLALPTFLTQHLPRLVVVLPLGGVLYTIGAVIYATRWPDPWPAISGFHELFHVFAVAGAVALAAAIWIWALPFPRG